MAKIKVGQMAPVALLEGMDGEKVSLTEFWQAGHPTLLIFLRHLA
jgi:hypothetical protein